MPQTAWQGYQHSSVALPVSEIAAAVLTLLQAIWNGEASIPVMTRPGHDPRPPQTATAPQRLASLGHSPMAQAQREYKYTIKSICYIYMILLVILYLFDYIEYFQASAR